MADQLATPQELASLLQLTYADLSAAQQATMQMLVEMATGDVQRAAGGQRIVDLTDTAVIDVLNLSQWLSLPQFPVRSVVSVTLDGDTLTDWRIVRQKLWRRVGWLTHWDMPSQVTVTYAHGLLADAQDLQLAKKATLSLAISGWGNPAGLTAESIDDYRVTYDEARARMELSPYTAEAIATAYGASAYVTDSHE